MSLEGRIAALEAERDEARMAATQLLTALGAEKDWLALAKSALATVTQEQEEARTAVEALIATYHAKALRLGAENMNDAAKGVSAALYGVVNDLRNMKGGGS